MLSILNKKEEEQILNKISDEKLTTLIEDNFDNMEDMIKVAKSNAGFKKKLYQTTVTSEKLKKKMDQIEK